MLTTLPLIRHQAPVLRAIGRTALRAVQHKVKPIKGLPHLPGPTYSERLPPRPPELVRGFLRHVGSPAGTWEGLPPHLFPQWTFAPFERALRALPYPPLAVLNGGCRLVVHRAMPLGEPLDVDVQLREVEEKGRVAVMTVHTVIGTPSAPEALTVEFHPVVRLPGRRGGGERSERQLIPAEAEERARWDLPALAGLEFAFVTGDFNPIHWIPLAAKASGFRSSILQGFSIMARAIETLVEGDGARLGELDVRFAKPLVLPAKVGVFVQGDQVFVGEAPGTEPFLVGRFGLRG